MVDARLGGKSEGLAEPYAVIGHLVDTAQVCGAVWDRCMSPTQRERVAVALGLSIEDARKTVMFWAGLHDLGKIMPQFQDMLLKDRPQHRAFLSEPGYAHDRGSDSETSRVRHEYATHAALPSLLIALGYPRAGRPAGLLLTQIAQVLGGHHGRYPHDNEPGHLRDPLESVPELGAGRWAQQREEHVQALYEVLGRPPIPQARALPVPLAVALAGMIIVSDWVASQEHVVSGQQQAARAGAGLYTPAGLKAHALRMERLAAGLLEDAGVGRVAFRDGGFHDLFPGIDRPRPLQLSVEAGLTGARLAGPGVLLVTAPTGEGKTETALYAATLMGRAGGAEGIFFALPTQATANQTYGRLADFARANLLHSSQLTLLHGAADLYVPYTDMTPASSVLDETEPRILFDRESGTREGARVSVEAGRWLRERGRGILAPVAVGTIDQALMGVLPLKRNALRHFGLSGKTVIVDEAHAYDAYTHALMLRLLEWLGALRVPVVLLSATLAGDIAQGMVRAYLSGAAPSSGLPDVPAPAYPGWIYAPADGGRVIEPAEPLVSGQKRDLHVEVHRVRHTYDPAVVDGRLAVLLQTLDSTVARGGCAAVICTTVAEAQQTYEALHAHYRAGCGDDYRGWDETAPDDQTRRDAEAGPRLRLLHARFPAGRRADLTAEAESWFGRTDKPGVRRPMGARGAVIVATQVIEQSLDLDFDIVVSDLAPLAMLLQRAGRIWRHLEPAPPRPAWAEKPQLVVLAPVGKGDSSALAVPPPSWGEVYTPSLLQRTLELLTGLEGAPIAVPEDVQRLVDAVYAPEFPSSAPEKLMEHDFERLAQDMASSGLAEMVAIPPPRTATSLHRLTTSDADEELVRTRLGIDSVQVLPVYENDSGRWLDEECTLPLPVCGSGPEGRFTRREVRDLLTLVAPVAYGPWRTACGAAHQPPQPWNKEPRLARLVLLPHRVNGDGQVEGAVVGNVRITYDRVLGLITERMD
ncbi:CRISPR-associated endonuclease Cas3'' [Streptomyces sp. CC53]|uniref:CRISPR-associated endonuclease Cas3'' n=1 Tax=Streptomyces sp. CC53 TaxID=1906740 RepID=UPI0008DE779B|nr:CRISPR-associated endonuclease Cas3'' [Streptomyces sp. CC53]OII63099.1 CRISPR-associated endonuclease Cas3'' [Streptomyces sp. CC53]